MTTEKTWDEIQKPCIYRVYDIVKRGCFCFRRGNYNKLCLEINCPRIKEAKNEIC
jgi:hypothetical protein